MSLAKSLFCFILLLALTATTGFAQPYPSRFVRFIVPFAPVDNPTSSRASSGQKLSERWDQPVIIENKPGAATTIAPTSSRNLRRWLHDPVGTRAVRYHAVRVPKLPYDSRKDSLRCRCWSPIRSSSPSNPAKMPVKTTAEFVAAIKKEPGLVSYGTPG